MRASMVESLASSAEAFFLEAAAFVAEGLRGAFAAPVAFVALAGFAAFVSGAFALGAFVAGAFTRAGFALGSFAVGAFAFATFAFGSLGFAAFAAGVFAPDAFALARGTLRSGV